MQPDITQEDLSYYFRRVDKDQDGRITYKEYLIAHDTAWSIKIVLD